MPDCLAYHIGVGIFLVCLAIRVVKMWLILYTALTELSKLVYKWWKGAFDLHKHLFPFPLTGGPLLHPGQATN